MGKAWVVRPKPHGIDRMEEFLDKNIVAIGWPCIGDLSDRIRDSDEATRDAIKKALDPYNLSLRALGQAAGIIFRFVKGMEQDNYVVVPYWDNVYFGHVDSSYRYIGAMDNIEDGYPHQRNVRWLHEKRALPRHMLQGLSWNSLKGRQTVFGIDYDAVCETVKKPHLFTSQSNSDLKSEYLDRLQRGSLHNVNPTTFEAAVCELLSKYYPGLTRLSTRNSPRGDTDLWVKLPGDVVVRIQVKNFYSDQGDLGACVVQQLAESMDPGDNGIIVTSGCVGQDACRKAEELWTTERKKIGFIDGKKFAEILFENIGDISDETLAIFGLVRRLDMI